MDIMVRPAILSDAGGVAAILRETGWFDSLNREAESETICRIQEWMKLGAGNGCLSYYVAEGDDGRVMGYAAVHWIPYLFMKGLEGYISELYIREADRGHGIGTLLLDSIKLDARQKKCSRLMLINLRGRESYHRQFYIKQGWQERDSAASFVLNLSGEEELNF
jgi:GNAT superfamily N-acetyltransferase